MNIIPNNNPNLELIEVCVFLNTTTGAWKVRFTENLLIGWKLDGRVADPVCALYSSASDYGVYIDDNELLFDGYTWEMMVYDKAADLWHSRESGAARLDYVIACFLGRIRREKIERNSKAA
jgi:hypothetical protein